MGYDEKRKILDPYLKENGRGCMAFSTLQKGLEYYIDENRGYFAYYPFSHPILTRKGRKLVIANPIAKPEDYERMLKDFIERNPWTIFVQVTSDFAQVLNTYGLQVNQIGIETELDLHDFHLTGNKRSKLRQWKNKCEREGVVVQEKDINDMDLGQITQLCNRWLKSKGWNEHTILTRPFVYKHEDDVRYFWATQNGKMIGMSVFDPMYHKGKIIGYYHNFDRISEKAPHGTSVYLVLTAANQFRTEGINTISLGMSPFCLMDDDLNYNRLTAKIYKFLFEHGNSLYPFKGNISHKNKYSGNHKKVYESSTRGNNLIEVIIVFKALKLI